MAQVLLCDARASQCRTPLWGNHTPPIERMFVCGAPALPGRSYCAACRDVLIAGELMRGGKIRMFAPTVKPEFRIAAE